MSLQEPLSLCIIILRSTGSLLSRAEALYRLGSEVQVTARVLLCAQAACFRCRSMTMSGHPTFNQEKLTKRAKRQVGFVLQVMPDPHHA